MSFWSHFGVILIADNYVEGVEKVVVMAGSAEAGSAETGSSCCWSCCRSVLQWLSSRRKCCSACAADVRASLARCCSCCPSLIHQSIINSPSIQLINQFIDNHQLIIDFISVQSNQSNLRLKSMNRTGNRKPEVKGGSKSAAIQDLED